MKMQAAGLQSAVQTHMWGKSSPDEVGKGRRSVNAKRSIIVVPPGVGPNTRNDNAPKSEFYCL